MKQFPVYGGQNKNIGLGLDPTSSNEPTWLPAESPTGDGWTPIDQIKFTGEGVNKERDLSHLDDKEPHADKLAWYRPHHTRPQTWGIYIREYGVRLYSSHMLEALQTTYGVTGVESSTPDFSTPPPYEVPKDELHSGIYQLAFQRLLTHEWFHFQVEYLTYVLEEIADEELHDDYKADVYEEHFPSTQCIEEALANAFVARSTRCVRLLSEALSGAEKHHPSLSWRLLLDQIVQGPPAYEAYRDYVDNGDFAECCEILATEIKTGDIALAQHAMDHGDGIKFARRHFPFEYADSVNTDSRTVPVRVLPIDQDPALI